MPRYTFQESHIWEAGDPVDKRNGKKFKTKVRSRDRVKLPQPSGGRVWVLIEIDGKPVEGVVFR